MSYLVPAFLVAQGLFGDAKKSAENSAISWKGVFLAILLVVMAYFAWDAYGDWRKAKIVQQNTVITTLAKENREAQNVITVVQETGKISQDTIQDTLKDREEIVTTHEEIREKAKVVIAKAKKAKAKPVVVAQSPTKDKDPPASQAEDAQVDKIVATAQISALWQSYCAATVGSSPNAISSCLNQA